MNQVRTEDIPTYCAGFNTYEDDLTIEKALEILQRRVSVGSKITLTSPSDTRAYLRLKLGTLEHEVFHVLFLDSQHHLIHGETMFRGTLTQTSVYPREVLKRALALNAGAVVLAHNHPSGTLEPSRADELVTQTLKAALALVDVRVIDHIIVSVEGAVSMAERGLL